MHRALRCTGRARAARVRAAGPLPLLVFALLGAAPAPRAQLLDDLPVQSVFTAKLRTDAIFPVAGKEPRFTAIKVTTKDLLAEFADRLALEPRRSSLVVRRLTALQDAPYPDFTANDTFFIADGAVIPVTAAEHPSLFVDLAVAAIDDGTAQKTVLREGALRSRTRVRVRGLRSGDLDPPPDGNAFVLTAVAVETALEKLAKVPGGQALLFSKRTLVLSGSAQFNNELSGIPPGFPEEGVISGTLTLSGERRVP